MKLIDGGIIGRDEALAVCKETIQKYRVDEHNWADQFCQVQRVFFTRKRETASVRETLHGKLKRISQDYRQGVTLMDIADHEIIPLKLILGHVYGNLKEKPIRRLAKDYQHSE